MTRVPDPIGGRRTRWSPARLLVGLVAVIVLVVASWTPAVRLELRRSFTRLPTEYAELYFTGTPAIRPHGARSAAVVSVTLLDHGSADHDYEVRFTLTDSAGAVVNTAATTLHARPGVPAATTEWLRIPSRVPAGSYQVAVALTGRPQTLHYRIDSKGTP